jgi:hypothetical protein
MGSNPTFLLSLRKLQWGASQKQAQITRSNKFCQGMENLTAYHF